MVGSGQGDCLEMLTILGVLFCLYWLPTIIAMFRRVPSVLGVAILNFFGFLIVPWWLALVLALAANPAERVIIIEGRAREI
jgi:hypothetical protein